MNIDLSGAFENINVDDPVVTGRVEPGTYEMTLRAIDLRESSTNKPMFELHWEVTEDCPEKGKIVKQFLVLLIQRKKDNLPSLHWELVKLFDGVGMWDKDITKRSKLFASKTINNTMEKFMNTVQDLKAKIKVEDGDKTPRRDKMGNPMLDENGDALYYVNQNISISEVTPPKKKAIKIV